MSDYGPSSRRCWKCGLKTPVDLEKCRHCMTLQADRPPSGGSTPDGLRLQDLRDALTASLGGEKWRDVANNHVDAHLRGITTPDVHAMLGVFEWLVTRFPELGRAVSVLPLSNPELPQGGAAALRREGLYSDWRTIHSMKIESLDQLCAAFADEIHQRLGLGRGDGPNDAHFVLVMTDGQNFSVAGERGLANLVEQGLAGVITHDFGPKAGIAARWSTAAGVYDRRRTHT